MLQLSPKSAPPLFVRDCLFDLHDHMCELFPGSLHLTSALTCELNRNS